MFVKVMSEFSGDVDLAHDSATETWLVAARKGRLAFSGESDLVGYCLFKVVKVALDLKRRRRELSGCVRQAEEVARDEESSRILDEARFELARAMALLPPMDRQILELAYYESFSDRAIAACLMGDAGSTDARRKDINRRRRAAEQRLRPWLEESSDLDWDQALAAFGSSDSNRRPSPSRRVSIPADWPSQPDRSVGCCAA
jgi:DNA-directed RNA polymerase specialized sigma24 family protein